MPIPLSPAVLADLRCPHCFAPLQVVDTALHCTSANCGKTYPVVNGIPIVLDEGKSIFDIADYLSPPSEATPEVQPSLLKRLRDAIPSPSLNVRGQANYASYAKAVKKLAPKPRVLVLGGRILGAGMELFANDPDIELVETDVAYGPRTALVCDAHDVPFADASFDGVIVQAVLEHVCDPYRCVEEIHRVLRPGGAIYAETPFIQQVHGGAWDFTRFTDLGHRRLFRRFEALDWGPVGGPGMALAWTWQYFLLSFAWNKSTRAAARIFSELTGSWLKYLDPLIIHTPGTRNAASGHFFLGHKSDRTLSDRELITLFRGGE